MGQIYRSVKLVLQNATEENMTVQGYGALAGAWADGQAPSQGMVLAPRSVVEFSNVSATAGHGTSGYIRFGTSHGYPMIRWTLPWTGPFELVSENVPGLRFDKIIDDSHPEAVICLATVADGRRR